LKARCKAKIHDHNYTRSIPLKRTCMVIKASTDRSITVDGSVNGHFTAAIC
jgi:hypothetical protein